MKKSLLLILTCVLCFAQPSMAIEQEGDTLTLSEEGTLSLLLSDMAIEKRIKNLTLRSTIIWAVLRVLIGSEGRIAGMEALELIEGTLVHGGECYAGD